MNNTAYIGLDDTEEWAKFSHALNQPQQVWESHVVVDGMHCAACAYNVEKALSSVQGVMSAEVNATSKRARITWSADLTKPSEWMDALTRAGYAALPASEIFNVDERRKQQRLMLWRLVVAGFCMMQVMMYAYPAYIADANDMTADVKNLLRWASWVLTLPVIFFSASPFFTNALNDLKNRQISMDLPVALGIVITFVVSSAGTFQPNGWWGTEVYFDSLTMFVFFLLTGRWLELRMRDRTAGALDVLMRRLPSTIECLNKHGEFQRIAVNRLIVGDVVRVLPGEAFPADGVVIEGVTSADEALLTGESTPVAKTMGQEVIAGSFNLLSAVQMRVEKLGGTTRYAQIVALMERASIEKPRLALLADRIARPFLIGVLFAAALAASILWSDDHGRALMAAVAVLIVTCPCALSLATPAAMLTISGALAQKGVLVRKMQALEALTKVDTIVFDKTGTLTQDQLTISAIQTHESYSSEQALNIAAHLANYSLHPLSKAIVRTAQAQSASDFDVREVKEVAGAGISAFSSIGPLKLGSSLFCGLENLDRMATSSVHLVSEQGWIASFMFEESMKKEVRVSIEALQQQGIHVQLLSGDNAESVEAFAKKAGIQHAIGACSPQDKLMHMQQLQQQGHQVAMIGDGLNDGPILALANVSIAMGQAVPLAQAQSDFVVMNNEVSMIVVLLNQAKRTMRIVKQNLMWAVIYNVICVPLAIMGWLPAWLAGLGMALSSLLVVGNALRLSSFPSQIFASEQG
ncbi:MAG: heavy metal translocating P-type ATPase [Methylophilaceae bacterium 17-43-7]|nr:MAG: heavy metal translocating P-type ATPase [Methylophilaceae bacterium 17-43-7]